MGGRGRQNTTSQNCRPSHLAVQDRLFRFFFSLLTYTNRETGFRHSPLQPHFASSRDDDVDPMEKPFNIGVAILILAVTVTISVAVAVSAAVTVAAAVVSSAAPFS